MNYMDLTQEIYHGHEQEYIPAHTPLSVTDSNPQSMYHDAIWRHQQMPPKHKPVCFISCNYMIIHNNIYNLDHDKYIQLTQIKVTSSTTSQKKFQIRIINSSSNE